MSEEMVDDKLANLELTAEDHDRLIVAGPSEGEVIWREIGIRDGFYPSTVVWDGLHGRFRARLIDQHTSIEDIDAGWTFNDWMTGWGPGERWRFTLSRPLGAVESNRIGTRLGQDETWNEETEEYDLDLTLRMMRRLCDSDLHVVRARKERVEAIEIKDGWEPVWPEPEDLVITDGK